MSYLKLRADHIFTGTELLDETHILITDEKGVVAGIDKDVSDADYYPGILTPGFINCHCHLELSHMKGLIPEATGLVDFVFKVVNERHLEESFITNAIAAGEKEMLENGIVAVGDICNNLSTIAQKAKGNLAYYNFIEASGWLPDAASVRFERAQNIFQEFEILQMQNAKCKIKNSIVPHAPYSVSEQLWEYILPFFEEKSMTIHNQETAFEDEFFAAGTGDLVRMYQMMNIQIDFAPKNKSSLQHYFNKLIKAGAIILVHNTFIKQDDIEHVKSNKMIRDKTFFCLCINANLYIEKAIPPVEMLTKNNCNIVLGTDSLASNHQLNILEEMKTISKKFPEIKTEELLKWATFNGAKALQMEDTFGTFEKGKKPGVVNISNVEKGKITAASQSQRVV